MPLNKFLGPINDVVPIAQTAIEDGSLPVDKSRMMLGGFSAGGNLLLPAAQIPSLKDKIRVFVAWYLLTDFTLMPAEKHALRPYRNAKDLVDLKDWARVRVWGYTAGTEHQGLVPERQISEESI